MLLRILLICLFLLSPFKGEANNCVHKSLSKLHSEANTSSARPVSFEEYLKAQAVFKKVDKKPHYIQHIRGEYVYNQKVQELKLNTGLHTHEAINFLKKMRPDIADDFSIKILPNGVGLAEIPSGAFEARRLNKLGARKKIVNGREIIYGKKSIFPANWNEEEIMNAVESIRKNEASLIEVQNGGTFITGEYKNVKVKIVIRNDEIKTVFPLAR